MSDAQQTAGAKENTLERNGGRCPAVQAPGATLLTPSGALSAPVGWDRGAGLRGRGSSVFWDRSRACSSLIFEK